jgi:hypothetical protein
MAWPVVAAMAAMGAIQGEQQRKAQQQANRQQAEVAAAQTEYSPWTGIKPQGVNFSPVTSSAMGGAAQGALSGAMMGKGGFGSVEQQKNPLDSWAQNTNTSQQQSPYQQLFGTKKMTT